MPQADREAWARIRADASKLARDLRKAEGGFRTGGKRAGKAFGGGFKKSLSRLRRVGGLIGGLGVGAALKSGFDEAVKFEDQMQRLGSQARKSAPEMAKIRREIMATSDASGIAREGLAAALDEMVNLQGGKALNAKNLKTFALGIQGTGTAGRDLAGVMFALESNMGITADEMQRVLGGIDKIGTEASIPFSQLASSYVEVAAAASKMGVKGPEGVFATVAAMQAMRKEIPTADEIKTSFTGLVTELVKKRRQIRKKFGIRVTTGKGKNEKARDLLNIFREFNELKKSGGFSEVAPKDVFGKRAAKGLEALLANFDKYEEFTTAGFAGASADFLQVRAIERANSAAGKMDRSVNRLKQSFAEPFDTSNINAIAGAIEGVSGAINLSIAGWRRLTGLIDPSSSDRNLIRDSSTGTVAKAGGKAAGRLAKGVLTAVNPLAQGVAAVNFLRGRNDSDLFPKDEVGSFQRPQVKAAQEELRRQARLTEKIQSNPEIQKWAAAYGKATAKALRETPITVKGGGAPGVGGDRAN